jgi:hypothetical protein
VGEMSHLALGRLLVEMMIPHVVVSDGLMSESVCVHVCGHVGCGRGLCVRE